jgi:hypothetical protein
MGVLARCQLLLLLLRHSCGAPSRTQPPAIDLQLHTHPHTLRHSAHLAP